MRELVRRHRDAEHDKIDDDGYRVKIKQFELASPARFDSNHNIHDFRRFWKMFVALLHFPSHLHKPTARPSR